LVTIGLILAAEALFVRLTHALQIPFTSALTAVETAKVASADHEYLVVMMLVGAMVGMISSFAVGDHKARGQLISMLFLPIPMVAALSLGLAIGHDRLLCLFLLPVITAAGTYLRRFGPRGMLAGTLLFLGFFLGFFLHAAVNLHDLGWLTSAIGIGLGVSIAVRFLLFFPDQRKALGRIQQSFLVRAQRMADLLVDLFEHPEHHERNSRRLQAQLLQLNEAALLVDAQLGDPSAVEDGSSRRLINQRLFDFELTLTNVVTLTEMLAKLPLSDAERSEVCQALRDIGQRNLEGAQRHADRLLEAIQAHDTNAALLHRLARSMVALADAVDAWASNETLSHGVDEFESSIVVFGGWLPGSTGVSSMASNESGTRVGDRVRLQPWTRAAIQMGVAMGAATFLGDLISPSRYYWAVIAVFITFMGANNSGEQTRKALFRIGGTVIGIAIGSLVVDAVGHHTDWSIAVIMVSLFFGFYLMRVNYTFMVIAVTVMVSQMYQELYEFSNSLLLFRLAETAVGAAVTIVVVTFLFPLRTHRVLRVAFRNHVRAVATLVDHAGEVLITVGPTRGEDRLRADARNVDTSYQALVATAQPLRRSIFGRVDDEVDTVVDLASSSRNFSRSLVTDLAATAPLEPEHQRNLIQASATLHHSMETLANAITGAREGVYVRSSTLFVHSQSTVGEGVAGIDRGSLAIRDLELIDANMAGLAKFIGLDVIDVDASVDK
jgi:uncharacterized membrane protein YgaE (UPF0421/DUF939 family)